MQSQQTVCSSYSLCHYNTWTHREKQVVTTLFAELTSVKFATQLQGIKSRQGTASARKALKSNLQKYDEVK